MKHRCTMAALLGFLLMNAFVWPAYAQDKTTPSAVSSETDGGSAEDTGKEPVHKLKEIVVEGKTGANGVRLEPNKTTIELEDMSVVGDKNNLQDLLKTQALFDFRGNTDLMPDSDTMTMRGFSSNRFVLAVDGLTVQKSGGRKGSHIVDYSLLGTLPIEKIEVFPGPHSSLFDSKAIGGAVNIVTQAPKRRDTLVPEATLSSSYASYNTQNHKISMNGTADIVTYAVNAQKQSTDGFLRYTETDLESYSANLGLLLPYEGYINVEASSSRIDRQVPVNNTGADFDSSYPEVAGGSWEPIQYPTWDKEAWSYKLNYLQNLPIGHLTVNAYRSMENRHRDYYDWINRNNHSLGVQADRTLWKTEWQQQGGKIQDIYQWSENHETTVGFEVARLFDGEDHANERIRKLGTYVQHKWGITPYLETKLGLRNQDVQIWVENSYISNREHWIERQWNHWVPKTYTTLKMDHMAAWLRDTSISLGVSEIWHAPDSHGDYNPQGQPAGAWINPEHGIGYDLVLDRRLFGDIKMVLNTSFYQIKDYLVANRSYSTTYNTRAPGYDASVHASDYKINLEEVYRYGIEPSIGGHLFDDLSFSLSYAWQYFDNQGNEPAGETELDDEAAHRVTAQLNYQLFENTALKLDYYFQSKESLVESDLIGTDPVTGEDIYTYRETDNAAYHVFNFAVEQNLFKDKFYLKDAKVQFYIKNLLDEDYYDSRGYLATDRTFGVNLVIRM